MGLPSYFSSIGFGSKVSTCETPPFMKRKITRFALGLTCNSLSTPPVPLGAASASEAFSIFDSATMPNPPPIRARAWRRVTGLGWLHDIEMVSLIDKQEFVRAEQRPAERFKWRILGLVRGFLVLRLCFHRGRTSTLRLGIGSGQIDSGGRWSGWIGPGCIVKERDRGLQFLQCRHPLIDNPE